MNLGARALGGRAARAARTLLITPELAWFVGSADRRENPYPAYRRLRRLDPAHRSPLGIWVLSGHAEVAAALRDPSLSSDDRRIDPSLLHLGPLRRLLGRERESLEHGPFFDLAPELLLFRDPPDHTRLRTMVNKAFTPRTVQRLEVRIRDLVDELLTEIVPTGQTEFMSSFAYPFPARVICELLGVPACDTHHIVDHAPALAGGLDPGPLLTRQARDAANTATEAITGYLDELIDARRSDPGDDLLSGLLAPADNALSQRDVLAIVFLLLIAGHETTANLLGNGIVALQDQPEAAAELREDRTLDSSAVDELLRFDSSVQMTMRVAAEAVTVDGSRSLPPGTVLILCLAAANRDPAVFDRPDRLDWHRPSNPHLAFGGGAHYCLGAPLARLETRIALRAILERLPDLALSGDPVRRPSFTVRGLSSLPLSWRAH